MTARNLLHKSKVPDLCRWLSAKGIVHRAAPITASWQIMQIQVGTGFQAIYSRANMAEHVSVPEPLVPLIRRFIEDMKSGSFAEEQAVVREFSGPNERS